MIEGMIIKSRLATDSPLYRLTEVQSDTQFDLLLREIAHQWSLLDNKDHNLVWKGELVIGSDKEWQLFQRLHLAGRDDIIELQVIPLSTIAKAL